VEVHREHRENHHDNGKAYAASLTIDDLRGVCPELRHQRRPNLTHGPEVGPLSSLAARRLARPCRSLASADSARQRWTAVRRLQKAAYSFVVFVAGGDRGGVFKTVTACFSARPLRGRTCASVSGGNSMAMPVGISRTSPAGPRDPPSHTDPTPHRLDARRPAELLLNPNAIGSTAHVTYLLDGGALVTFDQPGMAERAMHFGDAPLFSGGHDAAGSAATSTSWLIAEGATGSFFDTFVLIANPGDLDASVTMTYLPTSGTPLTKLHAVPAHQRLTINIATEDPTLASAAVSTSITSDQR
jgi:hypothetical protein